MRLSLRWAERGKRAFEADATSGRALFGIVQGGDDARLRSESARELVGMAFDGYAVGGLAVGEPQATMLAMIEQVAPHLPTERPRYLMGVGTPDDILAAVARGIDMFDCVLPTRNGADLGLPSPVGPINLRNARHADDPRPLDPESRCAAARDAPRAYLHHLVKANEMLAAMLAEPQQSVLLSGPDAGGARRDRRRAVRRLLLFGAGRVGARRPRGGISILYAATRSRSGIKPGHAVIGLLRRGPLRSPLRCAVPPSRRARDRTRHKRAPSTAPGRCAGSGRPDSAPAHRASSGVAATFSASVTASSIAIAAPCAMYCSMKCAASPSSATRPCAQLSTGWR